MMRILGWKEKHTFLDYKAGAQSRYDAWTTLLHELVYLFMYKKEKRELCRNSYINILCVLFYHW